MALVTSVPFLFQFPSSMGRGHAQPLEMGSGVRTPQHFYWPPLIIVNTFFIDPQFQIWAKLMHVRLKCFFRVFIKKSIISRFQFQIIIGYIQENDWFEVRNSKKLLGRGSPGPLHRPLPPFFLGFCSRFGLFARFRPPTFDAWLSHYHAWGRDLQMLCPASAEWTRKN